MDELPVLTLEAFPHSRPGACPTEPPLLTNSAENFQVLAQQVIVLTNRVNELTAQLNDKGAPPAPAAAGGNPTSPEAKAEAKAPAKK